MGFCRRCGDIVTGARCKCGGTPVAPVVNWNSNRESKEDRWSKTYVSRDKATSSGNTSPTKRFPTSSGALGSRVSAHIAYTTSQLNRPPSPLKHSTTGPAPESDILPSPHNSVLSKVYGSVLQPKESLKTHSCAICTTTFAPDATIYPDPNADSNDQFLCKPCFTTNGGSKGSCPTCFRPVLTLKSEGGFVNAAGKFWHKKCFACEGCLKNIGDKPMVDLLGRPCCAECFDNCLKRDSTPKKRANTSISSSPHVDNFSSTPTRSSPAMDELEKRLGILKRNSEATSAYSPSSPSLHESSPSFKPRLGTPETLSHRARYDSMSGPETPSPVRRVYTGSPAPTEDAIQEMKNRFLKDSPISSPPTRVRTPRSSLSKIPVPYRSTSVYDSRSLPSTPDLTSDFSDTATQFSELDSPPRSEKQYDTAHVSYPRGDFLQDFETSARNLPTPPTSPPPKTSTPKTQMRSPHLSPIAIPPTISASSICAKCNRILFALQDGGKFVTVPDDLGSKIYHPDCFTCVVCEYPFKSAGKELAAFVNGPEGPCHVECCPPTKIISVSTRSNTTVPESSPKQPSRASTLSSAPATSWTTPSTSSYSSSRYDRPPLTAPAVASTSTFPRFGSMAACPGCQKSVSPMERGVVPGPQGTKWHATCLVCGGKKEVVMTKWGSRAIPADRKKGEPGCGKKLDSAAKGDGNSVWCRECLLLLPALPQGSPTRSPILPTHTGGSSKVAPQYTGTTTIARQFTGLGNSSDIALMRQLTGGGNSPTRRSASPTKGLFNGRPRPKSVVGMRNEAEGRGMFLVRQMTGSRT